MLLKRSHTPLVLTCFILLLGFVLIRGQVTADPADGSIPSGEFGDDTAGKDPIGWDWTFSAQRVQIKIFLDDERDEYELELEHHAERYQQYVEKLAASARVKVEFEMLKGVVHRVIADAARRHRADVIVMGTAKEQVGKRSLLSRERQMILGEVDCAVLLVPPESGGEA